MTLDAPHGPSSSCPDPAGHSYVDRSGQYLFCDPDGTPWVKPRDYRRNPWEQWWELKSWHEIMRDRKRRLLEKLNG